MVTQTLHTISNAENKLEHVVTTREMRKVAEQWKKKTLDKTKELTEEICL